MPKQRKSKNETDMKSRASKGSNAPLARMSSMPRLGMSDLQNHRVSYAAGVIQVGNGSNTGTQDYIVADSGLGQFITADIARGQIVGCVPILPADGLFGATYVKDITKHYSMRRYRRIELEYVPTIGSVTAADAVVAIGPARGAFSIGSISSTTGGNNFDSVLSMSGAVETAAWKPCKLDLTPYIAGGRGVKQTDFYGEYANTTTNVWGFTSGSAPTPGLNTVANLCPCAFAVGGRNNNTSLRGQAIGRVYIHITWDLLDYTGYATINAVGAPSPPSDSRPSAGLGRAETDSNESKVPQPSVAGQTGALPFGVPLLRRQAGYVVVRQEDLDTASASALKSPNKLP